MQSHGITDRLFKLEKDYMVKDGYWYDDSLVLIRNKFLEALDKIPLSYQLSGLRYPAITIFDRFASRQKLPMVEGDEQKTMKVIAITCLMLAGKMKQHDIYAYDLVAGDLLQLANAHLYDTELCILRVLDWKLRTLIPMDFFEYFCSLLYVKDEYLEREKIENFLDKIQKDVQFTQYKPSTLLAAVLLTFHPVESYEQHFASCQHMSMDFLRQCIDDCSQIARG